MGDLSGMSGCCVASSYTTFLKTCSRPDISVFMVMVSKGMLPIPFAPKNPFLAVM